MKRRNPPIVVAILALRSRSGGGPRAGQDACAEGRGHQVHLRPEQDLPRHGPRLLGLRAQAVRPGEAGLRLCQPGRHPVQRAGRLRRADPQEGDAGHHRRVRHARAGQGDLATRRSTASTAATNTTAWATTTPGSSSTNCCPRSRRRPPRTAGRSGSRTTATTAASAAPAAARSARSRRPGSGPTPSAASSARSAPTSACAAATSIRR